MQPCPTCHVWLWNASQIFGTCPSSDRFLLDSSLQISNTDCTLIQSRKVLKLAEKTKITKLYIDIEEILKKYNNQYYLVELCKWIFFGLISGSLPVVEDGVVFTCRVSKWCPDPLPHLSHTKLCFCLLVGFACWRKIGRLRNEKIV